MTAYGGDLSAKRVVPKDSNIQKNPDTSLVGSELAMVRTIAPYAPTKVTTHPSAP